MKPADEFVGRKNEKNIGNKYCEKIQIFLSETDLVTILFRPVENKNAVLSLRSHPVAQRNILLSFHGKNDAILRLLPP